MPAPDTVTVFIDADNTLWDTDGVFAAAQIGLLADVRSRVGAVVQEGDPLAFVRAVDQAIAEKHQDGLRYPPVLLVRGLEKALAGTASDAAARAAVRGRHEYRISPNEADAAASRFQTALATIPLLRPGVRDGLDAMRRAGVRLLVISEASKERIEATAMSHGIIHHFERVLEGRKSAALYRRMLSLTQADSQAFMVGDQMNRDIEPAGAAGLKTIYFPGNFQPRWSLAHGTVEADYIVSDFSEVADIVVGTRAAAA